MALANNSREFIEIVNPGLQTVDLSDYYLSDDHEYALLPGAFSAGPAPDINASFDFIAKFPDGASIASGEALVVAFRYDSIQSALGIVPDFGLRQATGSAAMVDPSTLPGAAPGVVLMGSDPQLTNAGEPVILFYWDGPSDRVVDVDLFAAGDDLASYNQLADKTGVAVDGPDTDSTAKAYQADSFTFTEVSGDAASGTSHKRVALEAGFESQEVGGNGITGDDETSEDFASTWDGSPYSSPTPGDGPGGASARARVRRWRGPARDRGTVRRGRRRHRHLRQRLHARAVRRPVRQSGRRRDL